MKKKQFQTLVVLFGILIRAIIWREDPAGKLLECLERIEKVFLK